MALKDKRKTLELMVADAIASRVANMEEKVKIAGLDESADDCEEDEHMIDAYRELAKLLRQYV